ncbi:hypothetical protein NSA56_01385 [Oceanobacillus caeni]|uniref:hypothetical protein n=1 Tax=Oceanobacillus caeni TaxID=405946 RepID=UPI00214A7C48|nr:hypothetical protein [Oceanobacillus caeni]MCR1833048.1 hypothetical protein [Oceanobacillus caeni]
MDKEQKQQQQPKGPNKDFMINSLRNQLSEATLKVAEGDAILGEYFIQLQQKDERIKELEKDNEELRKQLAGKEKSEK